MKLAVSLQVAFRWKVWTNLPCEPKSTGPASRSRVKTPVENLLEGKHHKPRAKSMGLVLIFTYILLMENVYIYIHTHKNHTWMVWEMFWRFVFKVTWRIIPWPVNSSNPMLIVSPLRIGLWDPFQMAIHGLYIRFTSYLLYLLIGVILQVPFLKQIKTPETNQKDKKVSQTPFVLGRI